MPLLATTLGSLQPHTTAAPEQLQTSLPSADGPRKSHGSMFCWAGILIGLARLG